MDTFTKALVKNMTQYKSVNRSNLSNIKSMELNTDGELSDGTSTIRSGVVSGNKSQ